MRVLLIRPIAGLKNFVRLRKDRKANFPIGLGYIAAYLKENDYEVEILDNEIECLNKYELFEYIHHYFLDL